MYIVDNGNTKIPVIRFVPNVSFLQSKLEGKLVEIKDVVASKMEKVLLDGIFPVTVHFSFGDVIFDEYYSQSHIVAICDKLESESTVDIRVNNFKNGVQISSKVSKFISYSDAVLRITPLTLLIKAYLDYNIGVKLANIGKSKYLVNHKKIELDNKLEHLCSLPWVVSCLPEDAIVCESGVIYLYDVKPNFREDLLEPLSFAQLPANVQTSYSFLNNVHDIPELPGEMRNLGDFGIDISTFCFQGDVWFKLDNSTVTKIIDPKLIDLIKFEKSGLSMLMIDLSHFIYDEQTMSIDDLGNSIYTIALAMNKLNGIQDKRRVKDMLLSISDMPALYRLEVKNDLDIIFGLIQERNVDFTFNNLSTDKIGSIKFLNNLKLTNILLWTDYLTKFGFGLVADANKLTIESEALKIKFDIVGDNDISKFVLNYVFNHDISTIQSNISSMYLLYQLILCCMSDDGFVLNEANGLITAKVNPTMNKRFMKPYILTGNVEVML